MKPHNNIGCFAHGKATLAAAITSTLVDKGSPTSIIYDDIPCAEYEPVPLPRKPRRSAASLLAATAMLAGLLGIGGGRSSAMERNDPNREKTPQDLERMAAAQRKRDRKAARCRADITPNDQCEGLATKADLRNTNDE